MVLRQWKGWRVMWCPGLHALVSLPLTLHGFEVSSV